MATTKTATKEPATKKTAATNGAEKAPRRKDGLTTPQIRVLRALNKAGKPLNRPALMKAVGCAALRYILVACGLSDPDQRAKYEQRKDWGGSPGNPRKSLITLGYVKEIDIDVDGKKERAYQLLAAGKKAAEKTEAVAAIASK